MSGRFGHHARTRWAPSKWQRDWLKRGPQDDTPERVVSRNELQAFRLVLAKKEPLL